MGLGFWFAAAGGPGCGGGRNLHQLPTTPAPQSSPLCHRIAASGLCGVCVCVCVCICVCEPGSIREMAIYVVSRVPLGRWLYMCGPGSIWEMALYVWAGFR